MVSWPEQLLLNTDWDDVPTTALVENKPEVGLPIRRFRSSNIQHALSASFIVDYDTMETVFIPFMSSIYNGLDAFEFKSPVDSLVHVAKLQASSGQFYTMKRQDNYTYIINLTFLYTTAMEAIDEE